jgi:predicted metal-dependent phosphotriesterase family hydrolase
MSPELSETHVGIASGKVMTVLGPIEASDLGVTLMHEHILLDCASWKCTCRSRQGTALSRRAAPCRSTSSANCA